MRVSLVSWVLTYSHSQVPVGGDVIKWNAHRKYGRIRLPVLMHHWTLVAQVRACACFRSGASEIRDWKWAGVWGAGEGQGKRAWMR